MPLELQWAVDERVEGLEALLTRVCEACFDLEGVQNAGMTVRIASKEEVHALNREMRGVDRETDVLSFPTASFRPDHTAGREPAARAAAVRPLARAGAIWAIASSPFPAPANRPANTAIRSHANWATRRPIPPFT